MEYLVQQVLNALSIGGNYALLALGLAIVFSVIGLVNFAYGEVIAVASKGAFTFADLTKLTDADIAQVEAALEELARMTA